MENRRSVLIVILLISITCLSFFIYKWDNEKREIKEDLIELSNIKYGLFNVDEWKKILADIITKKIDEFEIDAKDRNQVEKKVMTFLYKVIGDLENRYNEQNSRNISGFIKRKVARITGIFSKVKQDIPIFTNQILDFVIDPKNEK
ncbi:MAG: hypothetical protein ABIR66_01945, partial [Saprospiraceae bacterium]